jgi:hypothetical protein
MSNANSSSAAPVAKRKSSRLNKKRCVVCGEPPAGFTGYAYFESGQTRLYAPFCQKHLDKVNEYGNPVFENQAALELFMQMHPQTYRDYVKDKPVVFFNQTKTQTPS